MSIHSLGDPFCEFFVSLTTFGSRHRLVRLVSSLLGVPMSDQPQLIENGRLNPGYLKLDLFCKGLRIGDDCRTEDGRPVLRVRAGLGSGLEITSTISVPR